MPTAGRLVINVRSITGYKIKTLLDEVVPAGMISVGWDAKNEDGEYLLDGFYVLEALADEQRAYTVRLFCLSPDCGGILDD